MSQNAHGATNTTKVDRKGASGKPRGFAAMSLEARAAIASKGGIAAHKKGTAHEFTADEARAAGRKGGVEVARNREHMANIGRKGGSARGAKRASNAVTAHE